MEITKEQVIIENLISSKDLFATCVGLIKPAYFSPEYRTTILFLKEYFEKYKALPIPEIIQSQTDKVYKVREITSDIFKYSCDSIETFCKESAMKEAIRGSSLELNSKAPNMGKIFESVKAALLVELPKRLGVEFYTNVEERLKSYIESQQYISTSIIALDLYLGGGLLRQTLTMFSANSGVGKSIMLANLGVNLSKSGLNVLYISLELNERMIDLRLTSISTLLNTKQWKENISQIAHLIEKDRLNGAGSYKIFRMANGANSNDIRSYLKLYELENGYLPDVIIVDYLDLMTPNEGTQGLAEHQQDKLKAEQLSEILFETNSIGLTASQQNRSGVDNQDPSQTVIAGGMTKINTVDNYIALVMTDDMRLSGQMKLKFNKTRSSDGVGKSVIVNFNPNNLVISDGEYSGDTILPSANVNTGKNPKVKSKADEIMARMRDGTIPTSKNEFEKLKELKNKSNNENSLDELLDFANPK